MRVLVTGGSGFTGSRVVRLLVELGHEVTALGRSATAAESVTSLGATPVFGDLDDAASVDAAFATSGAEALVNVASVGFGHAPAIVSAALEAGIRRAVFVSTTAIFTSLNAASKSVRVAAEEAITSSGLEWTIVRPTMIYGGPGDRNLWRLLRFLPRVEAVPLPDGGHRLQQPVHVDDLARAIVAAVERPAAVGRCYDVAGPEALAFLDMVEQAARAVGRFPKLVSVPAGQVVRVLGVLEGVGRAGPITVEQVERLREDKAFDIAAARAELGHDPRPFFAGIAEEAALGPGGVGPVERVGRYARTVSHLPAIQMAHRVRLRTQKAALARWPEPMERRWRRPHRVVMWPAGFEAVDSSVAAGCPSPAENARGVFAFLGERRDLGDPIDWHPSAPQLWRYHLHYWEWAWPLAADPGAGGIRELFASLWRSWKAGTTFGRWDEWSPYVVSVRAWVLANLFEPLVAGTDLEPSFLRDLGLHAGFVAANLEQDVGGNHLLKNLKAGIGLGVLLGDEALVDVGRRGFERELGVQVLEDGGHFELSPSYHAQVLGDLLDVQRLLGASGRPAIGGLGDAVARMRGWLGAMMLGGDDLPRLGDSWPVSPELLSVLGVEAGGGRERLRVLEQSGYVVVRPDNRLCAVVDVGRACPPQLPAHAQADCLSFVLSIDGVPVVVDPGTTTYDPGTQRAFERSTASHNTVMVDGTDQSEVWGQFRAGRLASPQLEVADDDGSVVTVVASHDGYERLPGRPRHRRACRASPGELVVEDTVEGSGRHLLSSRYLLDQRVALAGEAVDAPGLVASMTVATGSRCAIDVRPSATGVAGGLREVWVRLYGELPCSWTVTFRARGSGSVASGV